MYIPNSLPIVALPLAKKNYVWCVVKRPFKNKNIECFSFLVYRNS